MVEHELEEVEVHGQKHKPLFKIDYDFEQYKDDCPVCNKRVCKFKSSLSQQYMLLFLERFFL